jgi:transposase-like protein
MSGKRISAVQKEDIIRDIRARKMSYQSISKKHSVSVSTVSRLANELGLGRPQKKTQPGEVPEHSYDRTKRISALDRMLQSIDTMVERGGLSSKQIKDLAGAAKEVYATRRQEDIEPDPEEEKQKTTVWLEEFANDGSKGIGYSPTDPQVGVHLHKLSQQLDGLGHPGEDGTSASSGAVGDPDDS